MKYSFISRTLLINETLKVSSLYYEHKSWDEVKKVVLEDNLLQKNKIVSLQKQFSEIKTRLVKLSDELLDYLSQADQNSAKLILLLAVAKKYRLLYELIIEVIRDKYLIFNYIIFDHEYDNFLRSKFDNYPELEKIKDESRSKLKRNIFKILEESGLIDSIETKNIIKPFVPEKLIELTVNDNPSLLAIFLLSDSEIAMYKEKYGIKSRKNENREHTKKV